ncbi:MAG: hotdog fold thioesterase [Chlamydiae bacterium]|nr:hotdog fold thioesterase [Chlamydiota bacterium]
MSSIWFTPFPIEEINQRAKDSLSDHLGIEFTEMGNDFLVASMPVLPHTMQPMGILHGGATCALAETVGSAAANYCIDQKEKVCVGLEINVNHMKAVRSGIIRAVAKPFHLGKTTQVWDIKIYDEKNQLIAASRLTMAVLSK